MRPLRDALNYSSDVAAFMYRRHKRLSVFYSAAPFRLGLSLSVAAIILLIVPAFVCHVALIKDNAAVAWQGVGFWQRWNWSLMYAVVLPIIFGSTAALSRSSFFVLRGLVEPAPEAVATVTKKSGAHAADFTEEISKYVARFTRYVFWGVLTLSLILALLDTIQLILGFYGFIHGRGLASELDLDWSIASALPTPRFYFYGFSRPAVPWNIVFDVLAYSAQTAAATLGLFWIVQYWLILNTFSRFLVDPGVDFQFHPWWSDPDFCMGLGSVGKLFNRFLVISLLFQIYVVGHRYQLIARAGHPLKSYAAEILAAPRDITVLRAHIYFDSCTPGMMLLLIFVLLPVAVIAWVPLVRFRSYLRGVREERKKLLRGLLDNNPDDSPLRKKALREWK